MAAAAAAAARTMQQQQAAPHIIQQQHRSQPAAAHHAAIAAAAAGRSARLTAWPTGASQPQRGAGIGGRPSPFHSARVSALTTAIRPPSSVWRPRRSYNSNNFAAHRRGARTGPAVHSKSTEKLGCAAQTLLSTRNNLPNLAAGARYAHV
jgi:hypothetical protein